MVGLCPHCGKKRSPIAVVCPHCGEADASRDPRQPTRKPGSSTRPSSTSSDASILQSRAAHVGLWNGFFLPSPHLSGLPLAIDLALIVLTLPLVLGVALVWISRRLPHWRRPWLDTGNAWGHSVLVSFLGGLVIAAIGEASGELTAAMGVVGVAWGALLARVWLRAR